MFSMRLKVLKKVSFKPSSIAVSLSLLIREARLHLKYNSSFILSCPPLLNA